MTKIATTNLPGALWNLISAKSSTRGFAKLLLGKGQSMQMFYPQQHPF